MTKQKTDFDKIKKRLKDENIKIYDEEEDENEETEKAKPRDKNAPIATKNFESTKGPHFRLDKFDIRLPRNHELT